MVHQAVKDHMTQGAKKGAHGHGSPGGRLGLCKPEKPVVRDLLVPLSQQEVADHWGDEHHKVCNDHCTENGVGWAVEHVRPGQHANSWLDVHGHLGNAEGDHTEIAIKTWLDDEGCAHVKRRKWQFHSPS